MVQPASNRLLVESLVGAPSGLASLGTDSKVPASQIPDALAILAPAPNGTDDTAALQAKLTEASTSSFTRRVVGRQGVYIVSGLTIPAGVTLAGISVQHKAAATAGAAAITVSGVASRLESVEVDGNAANQTNAGILGIVARADRVTVADCYVHHVQWDGIVVASNPLYVSVRNNRVIETGRYGITINGAVGSFPRHTVVHGNYVERSNDGGLGIVGVAEDVVFSSNTTRDTGGDGIAAYSGYNQRVTCVGNTFYSPANNGIHLGGTDLIMSGNVAYDVYNTAWFVGNAAGQGTARNAVIADNIAHTTGKHAIWVQGANNAAISGNTLDGVTREHGMLLEDVDGFTVTGNDVGSVAVGRGVFLIRSRKGTVTGNHIHDIAGDAIVGRDYATGTLRSQYVTVTGNTIDAALSGIVSSESSDYWTVGPNTITGVTGYTVSLTGTNNQVHAPAPVVDPALRYAPTGALATTLDRRTVQTANIPALTSGTMRLSAVWLTKGTTIASITYLSASLATGLTGRWYALFDANRNLLGKTADDAGAWTAGTTRTLPLTAAYAVPADGLYYVGYCEVATTPTTLRGSTNSSNATTITPVLAGDSGTGLTNAASTPATSPGAWVAQGGIPFAYVS